MYTPKYVVEIVYMLQATEYRSADYLRWFWRTRDVGRVMYRKKLHKTPPAMLLMLSVGSIMLMQIVLAVWLMYAALGEGRSGYQFLSLAVLAAQPVITAHAVLFPLYLGELLIIAPHRATQIHRSKKLFAEHKGKKIVIAGSYGKTTMKEILSSVLGSDIRVAATPGNLNTAAGHARFAASLQGNEAVLILELGEYEPGDIAKYCQVIRPDYGIITGLAPAHLQSFGTLHEAGKNLFALSDYVEANHLYVNDENEEMKDFIDRDYGRYSRTAVKGWSITHAKTNLEGLSFTMTKGKKTLKLQSGLVGIHNVGPIALAAAIAVDEFGLSKSQVEDAVAVTKPYEHRLKPQKLQSGAWLIDDTYNGNIEGVRAAIALLREIKAKRKIYVTPGLVEQGVENVTVHNQIGEMLADAVDEVVLMRNSTTPLIEAGLNNAGFKGVLRRVDDPVKFYEGINYLVSAGDVVVLQNDWTDNYA